MPPSTKFLRSSEQQASRLELSQTFPALFTRVESADNGTNRVQRTSPLFEWPVDLMKKISSI